DEYKSLKKVFFIGVLEKFEEFDREEFPDPISHHATYCTRQFFSKKWDVLPPEKRIEKITHSLGQYIYVELQKFNKTRPEEAKNNAERWMMFFKEHGHPEVLELLAKSS